MYSVDDMKSCIQEWFAEACDCVEVAQTYSELLKETERQLEFMMNVRIRECTCANRLADNPELLEQEG